jgi:hypothetical protein
MTESSNDDADIVKVTRGTSTSADVASDQEPKVNSSKKMQQSSRK